MANILRPDCGWDPNANAISKEVTAAEVGHETAWDLTGITNAVLTYASTATTAVEITDFKNMIVGKKYQLIVVNDATTALGVTFPNTVLKEKPAVQDAAASQPITIEAADIAAGDVVVYEFWTDGDNIFVSRKLFA